MIFLLLVLPVAFSGCIQPEKSPDVKEMQVSGVWKPDGVISPGEYARSMVLEAPASNGYSGGVLELSWMNDAEYLYLALNGSTRGWISLGFEPSEWMKDSDIIIGSVRNGKAIVLDEYCTGNYGPHVNDTDLGGSYDILESGGIVNGHSTVIEVKRKMNTGDKFDKAFLPGQKVSLIWAMADNGFDIVKHNVAKGEGVMALSAEGQQVGSAFAALTSADISGLSFIWEEEKVSRDLYKAFYTRTSLGIFQNTSRSEQNHMDAVRVLLDRYGLQYPDSGKVGVFTDQTLQEIYSRLLVQGNGSDEKALKAAASFEEISIIDLQRQIASTDKGDIRAAYEGLLAGSEKHLRSYVRALMEQSETYKPQHLGQMEYDQIIKEP
ncbi:Uncharacterised protein [uncultured archaeon]|nr:Uncharacterised protein [uncultured archaeon]